MKARPWVRVGHAPRRSPVRSSEAATMRAAASPSCGWWRPTRSQSHRRGHTTSASWARHARTARALPAAHSPPAPSADPPAESSPLQGAPARTTCPLCQLHPMQPPSPHDRLALTPVRGAVQSPPRRAMPAAPGTGRRRRLPLPLRAANPSQCVPRDRGTGGRDRPRLERRHARPQACSSPPQPAPKTHALAVLPPEHHPRNRRHSTAHSTPRKDACTRS